MASKGTFRTYDAHSYIAHSLTSKERHALVGPPAARSSLCTFSDNRQSAACECQAIAGHKRSPSTQSTLTEPTAQLHSPRNQYGTDRSLAQSYVECGMCLLPDSTGKAHGMPCRTEAGCACQDRHRLYLFTCVYCIFMCQVLVCPCSVHRVHR